MFYFNLKSINRNQIKKSGESNTSKFTLILIAFKLNWPGGFSKNFILLILYLSIIKHLLRNKKGPKGIVFIVIDVNNFVFCKFF
jgi:hypothetical protein